MDKFSCAEGILCTFKVCAIKKEWLFINHNMVEEANFQKSNNEIFELGAKEKSSSKKQGCLNASFSSGECYNFRRVE